MPTSASRRWLRPAAVAAALLAAALMNPVTADASAAQGVISGSGVVTDDFADEATLSSNSYANSNATGLWQQILIAEGFLSSSGDDCQFGPATTAATKKFQARYGLTQDGIVGPNTWSKADNQLINDGTYGLNIEVSYESPKGASIGLFFRANDSGYYWTYFNGVSEYAYDTQKSSWCY